LHSAKSITLIGASNDFATLTITGVKKTQKMSYTKRPACKICECKRVKNEALSTTKFNLKEGKKHTKRMAPVLKEPRESISIPCKRYRWSYWC